MSGSAKSKSQRPAPFSIRLSAEERAYLERKAGNKPLGAYIRSRLLEDAEASRKPSRAPSMDYTLLGKILGLLGKSELASRLCLLAVAAEAGRVALAEEERAALLEACADMHEVRALLVASLGLKAGGAR